MEVEILCVRRLVLTAEVDPICGRSPLGGKDESDVVASGIGGCFLDLLEGKILDWCGLDGLVSVAEFWTVQLGDCGPCGEDCGLGIVKVDEADCLLVENDEVAVGEVVLGSEGVRWVDPDGGEESCGAKHSNDEPALRDAPVPSVDADEQDQRIHRQEITGEERAAEDGERNPVREKDDADGFECWTRDWEALIGGRDGDEGRREHAHDGDKHVHVGEEMEEAMPEAEEDAIGVEICGGVVAEELWIAEDEACAVIVVRIPSTERKDREE